MGQNYIITGATSGVGEECARRFADIDNTLVLVGRNKDKLKELENTLPGEIISVEYDLSDTGNIKMIFDVCSKVGTRYDGLIYSAGMDGTWPVKINKTNEMQKMMNVNCISFVEMAKYFYNRQVSNDNASIVAMSSIAASLCEPGMIAYSASKAALNAAVKTISKEFLRRKIRVNAIMPAGIDTKMAKEKGLLLGAINELDNTNCNLQPMGIISTNSIVDLIEFLLSTKSIFMTGELITVSAGVRH